MQFRTKNTLYTMIQDGNGKYLISGHEHYCPRPVEASFEHFPRVGERFTCCVEDTKRHPYDRVFTTTTVQEVTP